MSEDINKRTENTVSFNDLIDLTSFTFLKEIVKSEVWTVFDIEKKSLVMVGEY